MNLLFCCEFYHPSVGGVQEVMRQLAERLVRRGHQVTVATSHIPSREFTELNGVKIVEFSAAGNLANGLRGDVEAYRHFVIDFKPDAILIKAAQQWTFDALLPVLDHITARKVFIPCGFSGLYLPEYKSYFEDLPAALAKFDQLIFYAERYRDIDFARAHGLANLSILPNGASELEFAEERATGDLRRELGIAPDSFLFSTVGSRTGVKGHFEVAQAFARLDTGGRRAALVLNGNTPVSSALDQTSPTPRSRLAHYAGRAVDILRRQGPRQMLNRIGRAVLRKARNRIDQTGTIEYWIDKANSDPNKNVYLTDFSRPDVVRLFQESDLFVFASNIEYSPLVLYESAAAGTPFLTVPVGNAVEIAQWTGAGLVCPAPKDEHGFTRVDPRQLADAMRAAMDDPATLAQLATLGKSRWREYFTWERISALYEAILAGRADHGDMAAFPRT